MNNTKQNRWFRLKEIGDGSESNPYRPNMHGLEIDGWTGTKSHPSGPPNWIVRVYADVQILNTLEEKPGVVGLENIPIQALNSIRGLNRSEDKWSEIMKIK